MIINAFRKKHSNDNYKDNNYASLYVELIYIIEQAIL